MKAPMSNAFKMTGSNQQISFRPSSNRSGEESKIQPQGGPSGVVSSHSFSNNQRQTPNIRTTAQFEHLISPASVSAKASSSFNDYKNRQQQQLVQPNTHNQSANYSYKFAQQQLQHNRQQQQSFDNSKENRKNTQPDLQYQATGKDLRTAPSIEERQERTYFQTSIDNNTGYRSQINRSPLGVPQLSTLGGNNSQMQNRDEQTSSSNSSRYHNAHNVNNNNFRNLNPQANRLMPQNDYYTSIDNTQRNHASYDEFNHRDDEGQSEQTEQVASSQVDMEYIIMNLHSKMKNLENKYIDLANFYKRGLFSKKEHSHYSPIRVPGDQQRYRQGRDKSPTNSQQIDLDQKAAESSIMGELLAEKQDLERELTAMIKIQSRQQESEIQFQEKLDQIERENYELKQIVFKNQSQNPLDHATSSNNSQSQVLQNQSQFEEAQGQISNILNQFEVDFLDYINQNYNKFTEKDVVSMFGNLKQQMAKLVAQYRSNLFNNGQHQKSQSNDSALYIQLEHERQQLVEQHKNDLSSFELTHEYQIQNIKKSVFDLKSRQEMTKLDLKKLGLNLNNLTKSASELQAYYGNSDSTKKFSNVNMSSLGMQERSHSQNKRATLDPKSFNSFSQISPISPNNQGMQLRLVHDIQGYVQAINSSFNDVHQKVMSGDKDLKNLSQIEKDNIGNFQQLKDNLKMFVQGLDKLKLENNLDNMNQLHSTISHFTEEDQIDTATKHIQKLKAINDKLFREQQSFTEKFNQLKLENNSLKTEIDKLTRVSPHKQVNAFDYSGSDHKQRRASSIGSQYLNQQRESNDNQNQERQLLQQKLTLVQQDNENLKRSIKTLNRYVDDKNIDIERLNHELSKMQSQLNMGSGSADQIQFYQQYADQQIEKLRQLIKLAQKFLYSMKQLQKAVHRKENNVQQEKLEFETTRKDLESYIKELKKEIDQLVSSQSQNQHPQQPPYAYHPDNQSISKSQRAETIYQKTIKSKPQMSLSQRAQENEQYKRQSLSQVNYQNTKSFNVNNPYTISNSMTTTHLQEGSHNQRDLSPLTSQKNDAFHSIDPAERKPFFSSYERNIDDQSPTGASISAFNVRQQAQRMETPTASNTQIQSMKHDISLLNSELAEVRNERDYVKQQLIEVEKEKEQYKNDKQLIQFGIEKEKSKIEALKIQINNLEKEKQRLLSKSIDSNNHQRCQQEANELQAQNHKLQEDIKAIEKMSQEYKRTLQFLEQSAEVAKQTIVDQKESIVTQQIEIDELKTKCQIASQEQKQNSTSIKDLRVKLTAQIQTANDKIEDQYEQLCENLEQNISRLDDVTSQIDTVQKNAQKKQTKNPQMEVIINSLQQQLQELNEQAELKLRQYSKLEQEMMGKDKAVIDLQLKVKSEVEKVRRELHNEKQTELAQFEQQLDQEHQEALKDATLRSQKSVQDSEMQWKKTREGLQENIKQKDEQIKRLEDAKYTLERDLEESQTHLQQQIEILKQKHVNAEKELKKKESGDNVNLQSKEGQIKELIGKLEELEETISSQSKQLTQLQVQHNKEKEQHLKQIQGKEAEINKHQQQLDQLTSQYNDNIQEIGQDHYNALELKDQEIQTLKSQFQQQKSSYEKLIRDKDVEITSLEQEKDQLECELQDELQKISYESKTQLAEKDSKIQKLQNQISKNEENLKAKEQNLEEFRQENEDLQEQIRQQVNQLNKETSNIVGSKEQEIQQLKLKVQGVEKINRELKSQIDSLSQEKNQLEEESLETLRQHKSDFETALNIKEQGQMQLQQKFNQLEKVYNNLQNQFAQIQQDKDELESRYKTQVESLSQQNEAKLSQKTKDAQQLQTKISQLEQDLQKKEDELTQASNDLTLMQDQLDNEIQQVTSEKEYQIAQQQKDQAKYKAKISELEAQINEQQQQISEQKQDFQTTLQENEQDFQVQRNKLQQELESIAQQLQEQKTSNDKVLRHKEQEIQSLKEEKMQLESELQEQLNEVHQEKGTLLSSKEQEIHQLKQQIQNITKQLKQNELDVNDLAQEVEQEKENQVQLKSQLNEAKAQSNNQLKAIDEKIAKLQQEKDVEEREKMLKQQEIQKLKESIENQKLDQQESIQALQDRLNNSTQVKDKEISLKNNEIQQLKQQHQLEVQGVRESLELQQEIINQLQCQGDSNKNALQEQLTAMSQKAKLTATQFEDLQQDLSEKEGYIQELEQQINDQQNAIEDFQLEQDAQKQRLEEITLKYENQQKENHQLIQQKNSEHMDLDETRRQKNKFEEELNTALNKIKDLTQQIQDQENEKLYITQARDQIQIQLEQLQQQVSLNDETQKLQVDNSSKLIKQLQTELEKIKAQLVTAQENINDYEQIMEDKNGETQRLQKQHEQVQNEQKHKIANLESEVQSLKKQSEIDLQSLEQQLNQVQVERDNSIQQLKDMVNKTTVDKQSLESSLQSQLSETLSQLQNKEKDLHQAQKEVQNIQHQNQALTHQIDVLEDKIIQVESDNQSYQEALAEAEETREKHQSTLENNRNLIQMLKNELQKSIDKVKALEQNQQKASQDDDLKQQIEQIKQENEEKIIDLQMRIDDYESELKIKNELVEEANRVIEEFNDEKHELKAKFKHLMQIYEDVEEESSYKEDDEVNLEACFDLLEQVLSKYQQNVDLKFTEIEQANAITERQLQEKEKELISQQMKMGEVQCELMNAMNKCENNDLEMRKQMETAQRKIENYKEKLIEKQKYINSLEAEKKKEVSETSSIKDNIELLQKLQRAEQELQSYRQAQAKKTTSPNSTVQDQSMKIDTQKLSQIEDQLQSIKKQIFQAKDQVINSLSETFVKKVKDIQNTYLNEKILQQKLKEMKSEEINQDLNSSIKIVKIVQLDGTRLVIARLVSTDQIVLIDESKLNSAAVQFLHSFINGLPSSSEDTLNLNTKQQQMIDQLVGQIKEAKQDRQELEQELLQYKQKFLASGPDDLKEMRLVELEDDVGHLTSENLELRTKMKDLSSQNSELRLRVIELNEMVSDLLQSGSAGNSEGDKLLKLVEENQTLQRQLQNIKKRSMSMTNDEKIKMENSFLADIHEDNKRAGNGDDDEENPNLFDQSSLINVIEDIGGETPRKSKATLQKTIEKLLSELEEARSKVKNLTAEVQINHQQEQQTFTKEEQSVIEHIKGTLIQFLKNCPLTDKNNEELLAIVFSMMEFSKSEIEEVQQYRKRTRSGSVNPTQGGGGGGGNTNSSHHPSEPDEDTKRQVDKMKKSIFGGMFKKKDKDSTSRQKEEKSNSRVMSASPIRPIKR